jgi:hypothetical protein
MKWPNEFISVKIGIIVFGAYGLAVNLSAQRLAPTAAFILLVVTSFVLWSLVWDWHSAKDDANTSNWKDMPGYAKCATFAIHVAATATAPFIAPSIQSIG